MTDELATVIKSGGSTQNFTYDAYGNQTGDAQTAAAVTTMGYDLTGHLTAIDAAGTANDATFTLDALGRFRTRVLVTGGTDTYSYIDTSEVVTRIANSGGTTTDSIVSPTGDRLGVKVGATVNWFLPDLHGDIAASLDSTEATVVNAIRYDAYGQTIATGTAGGTKVGADTWKYQGRLDISPTGLGTPLYDMSARFYNPGIGAFTQFDSVLGQAQNPLSMHRFLYAGANPTTLIDPTGHWFEDFDPVGALGTVASIGLSVGAAAATAAVASSVGLGAIAAGAVAGAAGTIVGDVASGRGLDLGRAASGAAAGATFVVVLAVTKNVTVSGAAAGAVGNLVDQGIAYAATGGASGFHPEDVALSAGAGAAFGWLGAKAGGWAKPKIDAGVARINDRLERSLGESFDGLGGPLAPNAKGVDPSVYVPKRGETSFTKYGRDQHLAREYGPGYTTEVTIPGTKLKMDAVNMDKRHIQELKSDRPRSIASGQRQVANYVRLMNKHYKTGPRFTGSVVTYPRLGGGAR